MDIISVFRRSARRHADRPFLSDAAESVTYGEANRRTDTIAAELVRRGITDGATLGLSSPDCVGLWLAIIGCWKAGALPGLIDARTGADDLPYFVGDVGASLVVAQPELHAGLRGAGAGDVVGFEALEDGGDAAPPDRHGPEAPLYLSYTSGTTGAPKGAVLPSEPVTLGTAVIAERLGLGRDDSLLATTPISSSFQLVAALMPALHVGASIGLVAGRSIDEMWDTALAARSTVLVAYPLTLADIVNHEKATREASPFRLALSGGSPLAPRIKRDYRERLGIHLLESYGQSELGGFMAMGSEADGDRALAGFVGRSLPDRLAYVGGPDAAELPVGEIGEVLVTHGFFTEYRNKPEKTAETKAQGVLHTGDLAYSDDDGYLKVMGRTAEGDRAKRRGGFLREIEDAFYEHPAVLHATVVEGASGDIEAFVEFLGGHDTPVTALQDFAVQDLPDGLVPQRTTRLDKMPRSFSGKADRLTLSARVGA